MPANSAAVVPRFATTSVNRDDDRGPLPVAGANERDETGSGDHSEASAELVEDHECCDRDQQHPQELVAVTGPRDRVRRDPGGVVVGEAGEEARA